MTHNTPAAEQRRDRRALALSMGNVPGSDYMTASEKLAYINGTRAPRTRSKRKEPKRLTQSEAFADSRPAARELWAKGYRPIEARKLKSGMLVAFRATDIFQLNTVGPTQFARVERVRVVGKYGDLLVDHTGGTTETDPLNEVWAKPNTDPEFSHWGA